MVETDVFANIVCVRLSESTKVAAYLNINKIFLINIFSNFAFPWLLLSFSQFSEKFILGHTFCFLCHSASIMLHTIQ